MTDSDNDQHPCRRMGETTRNCPIHGETPDISLTHTYQLRIGPSYKRYKKKADCKNYLYDVIGCDMFRSKRKILNFGRYIQLPTLPKGRSKVNDIPPYFIINVMFPMYSPSLFSRQSDGETFHVIAYLLMKPSTQQRLASEEINDPGLRLLRNFVRSADMKDRFKVIAGLMNPSQIGISSALSSLIRSYNFKPLLTRPQHFWSTDDNFYIECDVDVHEFNFLTRTTWSSLRSIVSKMIIEAGFTIEVGSCKHIYTLLPTDSVIIYPNHSTDHGREDDELPEILLCRDVFHNTDPSLAPWFDASCERIAKQNPNDFFVHDVVPHLYPPPSKSSSEDDPSDAPETCSEVILDSDPITAMEVNSDRIVKYPIVIDAENINDERSYVDVEVQRFRPTAILTRQGNNSVHELQITAQRHCSSSRRTLPTLPLRSSHKDTVDISTRKARRLRRHSRQNSVTSQLSISSHHDTNGSSNGSTTGISVGSGTGGVQVRIEHTVHLPPDISKSLPLPYLLGKTNSNTDSTRQTQTLSPECSDDEFFDCVSDFADL